MNIPLPPANAYHHFVLDEELDIWRQRRQLKRSTAHRERYEVECMGSMKLKFQKLRSEAEATPNQRVLAQCAQYSNKLVRSLYQHLQDRKYCDFTLKMESDVRIPVHKIVLSSTSTYFSCLFESQMLETEQGFVELKDMKYEAILELVKFMYTGKINLSRDTIQDIVHAACHLQITAAIDICSDYLISIINKGNCVEIYNIADQYTLNKVRNNAFNYMRLKFTELPDEQLLLLNENQITSLVESDALRCSSEWEVFAKVEKWLNHIEEETHKILLTEKLMTLIRFPLMTGDDLVSKVSRVDLMKNEVCNKILTEAKDYHIVAYTQPVLQTQRTKVRHSDIIYMALCRSHSEFAVFPLFSPNYSLLYDGPVELRKPPRGMLAPIMCVYNNFLFACGGIYDRSSPSIASARCFRYDPRTDVWLEIASMLEARHEFDLEVIGDYMFALGGSDESMPSDTYEVYHFRSNEWKKFYLPDRYHAPYKHATVAYAHSVYTSGGNMGAYVSNAMVQYIHDDSAPGTLIVRHLPPMLKARKKHKMLAHNNKIFVFGGPFSSLEVFDVVTEQWTLYEGFADTLGSLGRIVAVCSLDPTRVVLVSHRESRGSSLVLNLEKDPVTEKSLFVKKLKAEPNIEGNVTSLGIQMWMPSLEAAVRKKEPSPVETV